MGKPKNLWKYFEADRYQVYATSSTGLTAEPETEVHIEDLVKRKEAYGICGECNKPGTGEKWCQSCNAKRFKENFKNWTSGNKDIDEFIQQSQLKAVYYKKYLEWIPFENFRDVTYVTRGGFGKIYSAVWPEGHIRYWDIENQSWKRYKTNAQVALKSLDNSSNISTDFLDEVKSYLQIYPTYIVQCYGVTQDPNTKDYMMVLDYFKDGNLRHYLNKAKLNYLSKFNELLKISYGLLNIHNSEKVHKDFHSGNILFNGYPSISDLGMCQPANNEDKSKGIFGVLPYMAPEVLCGCQYTKASDIYSFGIIMNEFISEEIPYSDVPHDYILAVKICKGLRPKISDDTPKLLADFIAKCLDAEAKNRPTAKDLYDLFSNWYFRDMRDENSEIYSQVRKCEKIRENKLKQKLSENIRTHPQAVYTSRLINFKDLPEPENSSLLHSVSEYIDIQLSESDLKDDDDN